ncbi:cell division control protein Cdc6, partial [Candidatus Geothermarchaeota archaeon ex4572_27]
MGCGPFMSEGDIIDKVFEQAIKAPRIFRDKSVLFHDYIPQRLLFRDEQIMMLAQRITTLIRGQRTSNLLIYGKPGTGKTAVTRYVINRLVEKVKGSGYRFHPIYVNCRLAGTEYRVVKSMADAIGSELPFTGLSAEEALQRFIEALKGDPVPTLIVLDEVDALVTRYGDKVLYALTRLNYDHREITSMLICISNDLRFKELLDPRVLSSL